MSFQKYLHILLVKTETVWSSSKSTILNKCSSPPPGAGNVDTTFSFKRETENTHTHTVPTDIASRGFSCPSMPPKITDFEHTYIITTSTSNVRYTSRILKCGKKKENACPRRDEIRTCVAHEDRVPLTPTGKSPHWKFLLGTAQSCRAGTSACPRPSVTSCTPSDKLCNPSGFQASHLQSGENNDIYV